MNCALPRIATVLTFASMSLAACGGTTAPDQMTSGCQLTANTSATTTTSPTGCKVLSRDTSSCTDARKAQGFSGFWLKFSCRVTLGMASDAGGQVITAASDNLPDYTSFYFPKTDACYATYSGSIHNPNEIASRNQVIRFPVSPNMTSQSAGGGVIGVALNGVVLFANNAAPGDDIFLEAMTFDQCGAHPEMRGTYHYHSEPYAISYDDANFIGVMRDGYPIYGRRDADGSMPTLDTFGGHTGTTADSTTAVYHYHVNEQTSTSSRSLGQKQWFLSKGSFRGTPASCPGC